MTPTLEHLAIVLASVAIGFVIAFGLVVISHRRRWLIPAFTGITGVIYTIPSIALFLLLLPITGRGNVTAVVALCLYTLQIIYRNIVIGLANVPASTKDAGRGMGMTDQQLFRRVELPLAVPEIIAGVRIATVSTVAIASLATFAGGDGLGGPLYFAIGQDLFKTGIFIPTMILLAMAVLLDLRPDADPEPAVRAGARRGPPSAEQGLDAHPAAHPRHRGGGPGMSVPVANVFCSFGGAIDFIFNPRIGPGGVEVGGLSDVLGLLWTHVWISVIALAASVAVALPFGVWFGHRGSGEGFAVAIGNAGRAIPELGLIAIVAAFIGVGVFNLTIALLVLGIPPILTNTFVGIRQVDRDAVEAARGIGMTEWEVIRKVELPLAVPTIMGGVRTGAINIIATATIAPLVGVVTLGDYIINGSNYGPEGVLAGAILVALLALAFELALAGVQRLLTPRGIRLEAAPAAPPATA